MPAEVCFGWERVKHDSTSVLTVGSFDGLHRGHRAILDEMRREAVRQSCTTTAVTFEPHPQIVLKKSGLPEIQILTTSDEKIALLEESGVDRIVVIPFTPAFAQTPSETFVREILHRRLGMSMIVIGHDHGFGKNREGDVATLLRLGKELAFTVHELPPLEIGGAAISSTLIRRALLQGDLENANAWLGHRYQLSGKVVRGAARGRTLGFPTLNLTPLHAHKLIPANGVYAVSAKLGDGEFGGMMNIGTRPTFDGAARTLEVHLFDFTREAYDETCAVKFAARLRGEKKFDSIDSLKAQLLQDQATSRRFLATLN